MLLPLITFGRDKLFRKMEDNGMQCPGCELELEKRGLDLVCTKLDCRFVTRKMTQAEARKVNNGQVPAHLKKLIDSLPVKPILHFFGDNES